MIKKEYWIWLSCGLGPGSAVLDLLSAYDWNPEKIYDASREEIFSLNIYNRSKVEKLKNFPLNEAERFLSISNSSGWKVITPLSEFYPKRLLKLADMPLVLFVNGNEKALTNEMSISIVGARKASDYGRAVARAISSALAGIEFTIVSGGALGVDSAAHQGALDENGETVCVLGCGLGTRYLMDNEPLRQKILEKGAVISEFPPFAPASRYSFPLRNRIISGMSLGTVVVEAGEKSGSLITARIASEQGRDVFAVPGDLVSSSYFGTNNLIRNGATPVFSPNDILEQYAELYFDRLHAENRYPDDEIIRRAQKYLTENKDEPKKTEKLEKKAKAEKPKKEKPKEEKTDFQKPPVPKFLADNPAKVYGCVGCEPIHVDDIVKQSGLAVNKVLSALTELEIYGLVTQMSGRRYILKTAENTDSAKQKK